MLLFYINKVGLSRSSTAFLKYVKEVGLSMWRRAVLLFYPNKIGLSSFSAALLKFVMEVGLAVGLSLNSMEEVFGILMEKGKVKGDLRMGQCMELGMMSEEVGRQDQKLSYQICPLRQRHWSLVTGFIFVVPL